MPVRNQNWYDLQAGRRYPLDDRSSGLDDAGKPISDDVIVDCHLRFPSTLGVHAFVQAITVTPSLVTIVFGAAADLETTEGPSIAAITVLKKDLSAGVNYTLNSLLPGVAGWVAFGPGIQEEFVGRYSTPNQTLILPRCARPYEPLPIPTIGKQNLATALEGLISIVGVSPVEAFYDEVTINDAPAKAIVLRLLTEFNGANPLQTFLGNCGERPESGTCPKPPIETINGISPDCDGNINIVFEDFAAVPFEENGSCGGGIDILSSVGLAEACVEKPTYRRAQDNCNPIPASASDDANWYNPADQIPPIIIMSESLPNPGYVVDCSNPPFCKNFNDGISGDDFNTVLGLFDYKITDAPPGCFSCSSCSSFPHDDRSTYAATGGNRNISLFRNCHDAWVFNRTIRAVMKICAISVKHNGGVVLNYLQGVPHLNIPTRYLVVVLDSDTNRLKVLRVNGTATVVEQSIDFLFVREQWYELLIEVVEAGDAVVLNVTAAPLEIDTPSASMSVVISNYGDHTGLYGLYSDGAVAYFNEFKVT